jgi:hypothetical protein
MRLFDGVRDRDLCVLQATRGGAERGRSEPGPRRRSPYPKVMGREVLVCVTPILERSSHATKPDRKTFATGWNCVHRVGET